MKQRRIAALGLVLALGVGACADTEPETKVTRSTSPVTLAQRDGTKTNSGGFTQPPPTMVLVDEGPGDATNPAVFDGGRTGELAGGPYDTSLRLRWSISGGIPGRATDLVLPGATVVVVTDRAVIGINRADGRDNWSYDLKGEHIVGSPLPAGDRVYFSTDKNRVIGLDADNGGPRLNVELVTGDRITAPHLSEDGLLYLGSDKGRIWRINPQTSDAVPIITGLAVNADAQLASNGATLFFEYSNPATPDIVRIAGLDLNTATVDWQQALPAGFAPGVQLLHADATLVAANRPGSNGDPHAIAGLNPTDGQLVWNGTDTTTPDGQRLPMTSERPLLYTEGMLIAQVGTGLAGIEILTGKQRWYTDLAPAVRPIPPARVSNATVTTSGVVYVAITPADGTAPHIVRIQAATPGQLVNLIPAGPLEGLVADRLILEGNGLLIASTSKTIAWLKGS